MPQKDLHDADVDALGQELRREAVAKRVRGEVVTETALCPCQVEGQAGGRRGQMGGAAAVGEEPLGVAMGLPDPFSRGDCLRRFEARAPVADGALGGDCGGIGTKKEAPQPPK